MRRFHFVKPLYLLLAIAISVISALGFSACNKEDDFYSHDNSFDISVTDAEDALIYEPQNIPYRYGLVFYVGTLIPSSQYAYLGEALARQGYIVIIPKFDKGSSYGAYKAIEPAFEKYTNVRFFVGGHGLGGGAAVRRAQENPTAVLGIALYSPICSSRQVLDKDGNLTFDENGQVVKVYDSVANLSLPTLVLEADGEGIVSDEMVADSKTRLNLAATQYVRLSHGGYTGFYAVTSRPDNSALTEQERQTQLTQTVEHTLAFMRSVVAG